MENAKAIGIHEDDLPNEEELEERMMALQMGKELQEGRYALNTIITRGEAKRGLMPLERCNPTIEMRLSPVPDIFPEIHAIISKTVTRNEGSPLSQIKSCNYGDNIMALIEARSTESNEAILLNSKGNVACASAGNIFCCLAGELVTPPLSDGVMDGVTRKLIIEKYNAVERSITKKELVNAAGIYISNSIRGVMHVSSLNGEQLPTPPIPIEKDFHITWHSKP